MRKILFLALTASLLFGAVSCKKNSALGKDGLKGYYVKHVAYGLWHSDHDFYRAFYLDGNGSGYYYWYVSDTPGYWSEFGESTLNCTGGTFYYQNNTEKSMTYTVSGGTVTVVIPGEGVQSFKISEVTYYSSK